MTNEITDHAVIARIGGAGDTNVAIDDERGLGRRKLIKEADKIGPDVVGHQPEVGMCWHGPHVTEGV